RTKSIANITKEANKNLTGGLEESYRIPKKSDEVSQVLISFESADPVSRKLFVDENWQVARVTLSVVSKGTFVYGEMMKEIDAISARHFTPVKEGALSGLKVTHSGGMRLMIDLVNLVSISQIKSFSLALIVISLLLFVLFESVKFGILAMIPNIFPIAIIMGFAGWTGIPMDSDTLLVLPIAIGIAVDDTIHFLTHYKSELINGKTSEEAIDSSLKKVGQALFFTSLVLTSGFFVFVFSAYIPLANFGKLSALAISSALLADLFLLPVLIDIFKPFKAVHFSAKKSGVVTASFVILALIVPKSAPAKGGQAEKIAKKVVDRDDGYSMYSRSLLISCEFREIKSGKRKCTSAKRKKVFESLVKDLDPKGNVTKSLSLIEEPPSEKGVAFLQEDYLEEGRDSLQWIYLPALKKLRRIVSSESGPKTGTMFGSEIAYEDIEKMHLSDYSYKILAEKQVSGKDVWVMQMIPTEKRRPKTSYGKLISYIDKKSYIRIRTRAYNKAGRLEKTFFIKDIRLVKNVWVQGMMIVVNHKNNRMSMMKNTNILVNIDFPPELVST
ncbi:MAG: outer membrane lipoprotein-sorting protein, partial [Nitrospinota bacterium]